MSYALTLDEFDEARLLNELIERMELRTQNRCDYCRGTHAEVMYDMNAPAGHRQLNGCKFPERHRGDKPDHIQELQARLLRLIQEEMTSGR